MYLEGRPVHVPTVLMFFFSDYKLSYKLQVCQFSEFRNKVFETYFQNLILEEISIIFSNVETRMPL
jgi:hypothetical protein